MENVVALFLTYTSTIYGTILWLVVGLTFTKDKYDDEDKKFDWPLYKQKNWDNWLLAIVGIPFVAHWGPDAIKFFFPELVWTNMGYALSGFIIQALYWTYKEWKTKNQK